NPVKTRFAPSPTGHLHVGGARTALYNYLLARKTGGTFLLRIEDTDRGRHVEEAVPMILADLKWLGIEWDEGIEAPGQAGPYRQSQRLPIYTGYVRQLIEAGLAYCSAEVAAEPDAAVPAAEGAKGPMGFRRPAQLPTKEQTLAALDGAAPAAIRFLCPGKDVTIHDEVFGDVCIPADQQEDFVILKSDGFPTYNLANVVDDELMGVTMICRGQEFLGQSWRQALLREALGFRTPLYAHLPLIMDMQGRKLSKRDGDVDVHSFRKAGYLPEALVNFIALLGWNPGGERERMSMKELVELFSPDRIGKSNAKFDREKLLAFNTDAGACADEDRLLVCFRDYLSLNETPIPGGDAGLLRRLLRINKGFRTFADIPARCGVLFKADTDYAFDEKAVVKVLVKGEPTGYAVLAEIRGELAGLAWEAPAIESWVEKFCAARSLGMGKVAQPIRVAVTGNTVSPAIVDTLVLLGREKTLARIDRCLAGKTV
ncbi:MAG: glutamate--tRNA ligase, partial [Planctomycetota bacterium]|nr:glutamate--tRNA ligase [Planctomycetota bacterium]